MRDTSPTVNVDPGSIRIWFMNWWWHMKNCKLITPLGTKQTGLDAEYSLVFVHLASTLHQQSWLHHSNITPISRFLLKQYPDLDWPILVVYCVCVCLYVFVCVNPYWSCLPQCSYCISRHPELAHSILSAGKAFWLVGMFCVVWGRDLYMFVCSNLQMWSNVWITSPYIILPSGKLT